MTKTKLSSNFFYLWLLVWPWSTKLILRPAETNYLEIAFYLSNLFLLIPIGGQLIKLFKNRKLENENKKIQPLWWWGVMVIFIISTLSIIWSLDQSLALFRWLSLVSALVVFVLVLKSPALFRERALKFFLLGLIVPALLGIIQFSSQLAPANKYFGLAAHNPDDLGVSVIETNSGRFLRAYGSFDHPNILGGVMALAALLTLYLGAKEKNRKLKTFYLVAWLIFLTGLFISFSRSAGLAFVFGFLGVMLTQIKIIWRQGKVFLLSGVILLLVFASAFSSLLLTRAGLTARLEAKSLTERSALVVQAKEVIKGQLLMGTGLGGYISALMRAHPSFSSWDYQPVHNYWLLVMAELGFFGFLAFILLWLGALKKSLKAKLWPFWVFLLVISFFDHWLFSQPIVPLAIFFILGYLSASD